MAQYEVVVGNVGRVYSGPSEVEARRTYGAWKIASMLREHSRAYGENVALFRGDDVIAEYWGATDGAPAFPKALPYKNAVES